MSESKQKFLYSFSDLSNPELSCVGGKAFNLIKLSQAGFFVPRGYVVKTTVHDYYLKNHQLPPGLIQEIITAKKDLHGCIALRSSANYEDGDKLSMAGIFTTVYLEDDSKIEPAIKQIYDQAHSEEVKNYLNLYNIDVADVKMGLIVQKLIKPDLSGVIYTGINGDNILVQYVDGYGDKLVNGEVNGSSFLVNYQGKIIQSSGFDVRPFSDLHLKKLIHQVKKTKKLFPKKKQDIEFACQGDDFFFLQARTLTTQLDFIDLKQSPEKSLQEAKELIAKWISIEKLELKTKTAVFSDSNYSELLPKPAPMDIGIYQYISGGSDGIEGATQIGRKEMGYLVDDRAIGIIHYLGGRTYFSLARNAAIYNIGFPDNQDEYFKTLVNEYLDKVTAKTSLGAYPQMGLYLQDPTLADLKKRFGVKAEDYFTIYQKFTKKMKVLAKNFLTDFKNNNLPKTEKYVVDQAKVDLDNLNAVELANRIMALLEHIRTKTYVDFVKSARLGFYYSQRLRDLFSDEIYSKLNQGLDGSAVTEANLEIAQAKSLAEALKIAKEKIGHFSSGEMLEIRHLPLRDSLKRIRSYVQGIRESGTYVQDFKRQKQIRLKTQQQVLAQYSGKEKIEIAEIIAASQTYMALRETVKYLFTKEYLLIRDSLEHLADILNLKDGDIYYLFPREIPNFVKNPKKFKHLIAARKQFFINAELFDLPAVIREADVENLNLKNNETEEFTVLTGGFLADGENFFGIVVNSDEFSDLAEALNQIKKFKQTNKKVILVAKQMNLSHDPLIIQADGLVIENAGLVAHGAQRARELGKGAMSGIKSRVLPTGLELYFNINEKKIEKV